MLSLALQPPRHPGQAVKELQTSTREAIVLLKAMIEEVRNSASEEEAAINSLFSRMQVRGSHPHIKPCARGTEPGQWEGTGVAAGHRAAVPFAGAALREKEDAPESCAEVRDHRLSPVPGLSLLPKVFWDAWGWMAPWDPAKAVPCPALLQPARGKGEGIQGAARPPCLPAAHTAGRASHQAGTS